MTKPKRGKTHFEGPPKAMRDLEVERLAEDGGSKTQEFFKERVARQEALRDMRVAMEQQARHVRLVATTMTTTSDSREWGKEGGREAGSEGRQASFMVDVGPFSTVVTWGGLRKKHRRDKEDLAMKFRAEHDWYVHVGREGGREGGIYILSHVWEGLVSELCISYLAHHFSLLSPLHHTGFEVVSWKQ